MNTIINVMQLLSETIKNVNFSLRLYPVFYLTNKAYKQKLEFKTAYSFAEQAYGRFHSKIFHDYSSIIFRLEI